MPRVGVEHRKTSPFSTFYFYGSALKFSGGGQVQFLNITVMNDYCKQTSFLFKFSWNFSSNISIIAAMKEIFGSLTNGLLGKSLRDTQCNTVLHVLKRGDFFIFAYIIILLKKSDHLHNGDKIRSG